MKKFTGFSAVSAIALLGVSVPAQADVNVWRDPVSKMTVSYADTWDQIHNQHPDDVLTVKAPGVNDFAVCRVSVADEARLKIYPRRNAGAIQRLFVSQDYWEGYLAQYDNVVVHAGTDNNGLGDGFASMAQVSYETPYGVKMNKRAIGFATHYRDRIYTVECSAEESAYHKWHNAFLGFIKSVDFHNGTNFAISGFYRDFLQDKTLKVRGPSVVEDTYY